MTALRKPPSTFVASAIDAPGAGTSTAKSRKSGIRRLRSSVPPLACGFAPMRRSPSGASARSSGTSRPSAPNSSSGR